MRSLTARVLEWVGSRLLELQKRLGPPGEVQPAQLEGGKSAAAIAEASAVTPAASAPVGFRQDSGDNGHENELLYRVAHELKAPLTAIVFSSELLSVLELLDANRDNHKETLIENISGNARKLNRRITDLLGFIATQNGGLEIEPQYLEVGPVLMEVASQQLVMFNKKRQTLKLEIPESLPMVRADKSRLEHVVTNLLEHVNESSPEGTTITVAARESLKEVVVEVKDSAPVVDGVAVGVNPADHAGDGRVTRQPFPVLETGLAISKRLVELQQGEIWLESMSSGNTFAFTLPMME